MRPVLSRAQMRAYDKYAVESCHVPGSILMENAGRGATDVLARLYPLLRARFVVVCGEGNNGGDGFVVARHLHARGADVHVFLAGKSETVMGDARINHDAYIDLGGRFSEVPEGHSLEALAAAVSSADVIVDAIFGTGLGRPVLEHLAHVIDAINGAKGARVALDLPSGLDADTGSPLGATVRAHHTITFGHLKVGLLTPEGARLAGHVHVVDLGVPDTIVAHTGLVAQVMDDASVASWLRTREANVYKHAAGSVCVIAGSPGKVGAAVLVGEGALRSGAGLCTVATWTDSAPAIEARARELMTARIDPDDLEGSIDRALARQNVVAIGPGFGLGEAARRAVEHVVLRWEGAKIVDADAITCFAGRPEALASARGTLVLTPHSGELGTLLGISALDVEKDRFGAAREAARRAHAVVLLKGARTLVADGDDVLVNVTGNPALATAGSGDVLTGILAGLSCTLPPARAAAAAAFMHGKAADAWRAAHAGADRGMLASEIAERVPAILGELLGGHLRGEPRGGFSRIGSEAAVNPAHPIDRLPALLLGDEDDAAVEEHVATCAECAAELASLREVVGRLPGVLPHAEGGGEARHRLLGSVDHLERFVAHAPALGRLFDLTVNDARLCLHALSSEAGWKPAPVRGITWRSVSVGPLRRPGKGMLARLEPGATFPNHRHGGDEHLLVLSGELVEGGVTIGPGSLVMSPTGTSHTIAADAAGPGCVCALLNLGPIEIVP